jgi:predicted esterase
MTAYQQHQILVPRTARYVTQGDLDGDVDDVWFVLHGYGQLAAEFLEGLRPVERPKRRLIAPEALSRFYHEDHETVGASWMTREDRLNEMADYIRYLDLLYERIFERLSRDSVTLTLFGFSQGVATAARWATRGKPRADRLILWGGLLPPELDDEQSLAPLRKLRLTLVYGNRDPFVKEAGLREQRDRLARWSVDFEEKRFAGGHRLHDETLKQLAKYPAWRQS